MRRTYKVMQHNAQTHLALLAACASATANNQKQDGRIDGSREKEERKKKRMEGWMEKSRVLTCMCLQPGRIYMLSTKSAANI